MDNCKISPEQNLPVSQIVESPIANQAITADKTDETVESPMNFEKTIAIANQAIKAEKTEETIQSPMNFEKPIAIANQAIKAEIGESPVSFEKKSLMRKDSGLKSITPVQRLQLPKASNFSDRCMSPTDQLISPVSRRLLSRNRKGSGLSAPPKNVISKEIAAPTGI